MCFSLMESFLEGFGEAFFSKKVPRIASPSALLLVNIPLCGFGAPALGVLEERGTDLALDVDLLGAIFARCF